MLLVMLKRRIIVQGAKYKLIIESDVYGVVQPFKIQLNGSEGRSSDFPILAESVRNYKYQELYSRSMTCFN
jgi:hypothetical protein